MSQQILLNVMIILILSLEKFIGYFQGMDLMISYQSYKSTWR